MDILTRLREFRDTLRKEAELSWRTKDANYCELAKYEVYSWVARVLDELILEAEEGS